MALVSMLGRSISPRRTAAVGALAAGAGAAGFLRGLGREDLSSGVYEMATGDPNIDQYVFGTDMGMRELMMPLPGERMSQRMRMVNSRLMTRHSAMQRSGMYRNRMPTVNGDVVFGAYNSRMG